MAKLTIELPDSMRDFVEAEVAAGHYESASALIQALLERAQWRVNFEEKLEEGLRDFENGNCSVWKKGDAKRMWEELRRQRTNVP
jgi:Arc/MetJ-type ribon-helix-helix transcriptional regulator